MRIASYQFPVFKPYRQPTFEIYFQGCSRSCVGCHNLELKDFDGGIEMTTDEVFSYITERADLIECISFTGGDPLFQDHEELKELGVRLALFNTSWNLWLFTGEDDFMKIPDWCKVVFTNIKYGSYREDLAQEGFPSSSNQQVWGTRYGKSDENG